MSKSRSGGTHRVWFASGQVHSVGLAYRSVDARSTMSETEAWGHPRDATPLPAARQRFWTQGFTTTAQLRNASAAIGKQRGRRPRIRSGYNRVWVQCGQNSRGTNGGTACAPGARLSSNGPLLRVKAGGQWPGTSSPGTTRSDRARGGARRTRCDAVDRIIKNGRQRAVPRNGAPWRQRQIEIPRVDGFWYHRGPDVSSASSRRCCRSQGGAPREPAPIRRKFHRLSRGA